MIPEPRGFTLLIAILMSTVAVTLGVSLIDIAYKQVVLASTAKQSQIGFYAADSAMECALYWDQQKNVFRYDFPGSMGNDSLNVKCQGRDVTNYSVGQVPGGNRTTSFTVPCVGGGVNGKVTVIKNAAGVTQIYANGYSTCIAEDQRRVERGLKVFY